MSDQPLGDVTSAGLARSAAIVVAAEEWEKARTAMRAEKGAIAASYERLGVAEEALVVAVRSGR